MPREHKQTFILVDGEFAWTNKQDKELCDFIHKLSDRVFTMYTEIRDGKVTFTEQTVHA